MLPGPRPEEHRDRGHAEDDGLPVDVRARDEQLQQQRVGRPQQGGAQLAGRIAARHAVQQQGGAGERGQVGQAEHEHGEPGRGAADQRGQPLHPGRERPVDRGAGEPVLDGPRDRVAERGQLGRRGRVRVVAGDQHPPVGGVAQLVRGSEGRHQGQRDGGQQPGQQDGPRRDRPAAAHGPQREHQPERAGRQRGGGEPDRQVRRQVRGERPGRLAGAAGQHRLHDRGPGHRDRERERDADRHGSQAQVPLAVVPRLGPHPSIPPAPPPRRSVRWSSGGLARSVVIGGWRGPWPRR